MVSEETIERLEAEAKIHDAEPEDLSVYPESHVEELEETADELGDELADAEDRVEELEGEVESLEEDIEALEDEVTAVAEVYAEKLAEVTGLDEETLLDRFDVTELREEFEARLEDEEVEELGEEPAPQSGDLTEEEEMEETGPDLSPEEEAEVERLEVQIEKFEDRGGAWAGHAESLRDEKAEILGE